MKRRLLLILALSLGCSPVTVLSQRESRTRRTPTKVRSIRTKQASQDSQSAKTLLVRQIDAAGLRELLPKASAQETKNARPLLVNFWATWCEPCRDEFPDLVQIDADFRQRGLQFITVSLDDLSGINTTVPQFLQQMRATQIPAYLLNTLEPEAAITAVDPTWAGGLPATFLFDAQGQLVFKHMGRVKPAELRAAINKIIK